MTRRVAVVVPVYGNAADAARSSPPGSPPRSTGRDWRLRLVVDASPDDSAAVARGLAEDDRGSRSPS